MSPDRHGSKRDEDRKSSHTHSRSPGHHKSKLTSILAYRDAPAKAPVTVYEVAGQECEASADCSNAQASTSGTNDKDLYRTLYKVFLRVVPASPEDLDKKIPGCQEWALHGTYHILQEANAYTVGLCQAMATSLAQPIVDPIFKTSDGDNPLSHATVTNAPEQDFSKVGTVTARLTLNASADIPARLVEARCLEHSHFIGGCSRSILQVVERCSNKEVGKVMSKHDTVTEACMEIYEIAKIAKEKEMTNVVLTREVETGFTRCTFTYTCMVSAWENTEEAIEEGEECVDEEELDEEEEEMELEDVSVLYEIEEAFIHD